MENEMKLPVEQRVHAHYDDDTVVDLIRLWSRSNYNERLFSEENDRIIDALRTLMGVEYMYYHLNNPYTINALTEKQKTHATQKLMNRYGDILSNISHDDIKDTITLICRYYPVGRSYGDELPEPFRDLMRRRYEWDDLPPFFFNVTPSATVWEKCRYIVKYYVVQCINTITR